MSCDECGDDLFVDRSECRARFDEACARDYSDPRFFAVHDLLVDSYCLQHPDQFCRSGKSFAAHLTRLFLLREEGGQPSRLAAVRAWLDGPDQPVRPPLTVHRGTLTLGRLAWNADAEEWACGVRAWAADIWRANVHLHPVAAEWVSQVSRR